MQIRRDAGNKFVPQERVRSRTRVEGADVFVGVAMKPVPRERVVQRTDEQLVDELALRFVDDVAMLVPHVDRTHLTRDFYHASLLNLGIFTAWLKSCAQNRIIHTSSIFAHERSSPFSCSHSPPLTLPSLSLTTSSTLTSQRSWPDQETRSTKRGQ